MALGVDELAAVACKEILSLVPPAGQLTLHCVGHSMGGIIIRGALPGLLERLGERVTLGHYLSLSTPHLGIRASWSSPLHAWRNLAAPLTACVTSQISQLAVANEPEGASKSTCRGLSSSHGRSRLHVGALRPRRALHGRAATLPKADLRVGRDAQVSPGSQRPCWACHEVADGDRLVSLPSGIIDPIRPKPETLKQVPRLQRLRPPGEQNPFQCCFPRGRGSRAEPKTYWRPLASVPLERDGPYNIPIVPWQVALRVSTEDRWT